MTKSCEILNYISSKGKYCAPLLLHCFKAIHSHQSKWGYVTSELLEESVSDGTKIVSNRIYSTVDITAHLALLVEVTIDIKVIKSRIRLISRSVSSDLSDEQHVFFHRIIACLIEKVNLLPYGIGKLTPFSYYVDDFKAEAAKSCNFKEDYCYSSASKSINGPSASYSSVSRDRASSFSGMATDKSGTTTSSYSTPSSRVPSPSSSFVKSGASINTLPRHGKAERITPRRMDKFSLPPSAERNADCKVSNVAFMALVRRDGSDIIFPQISHDKLLCVILAAITSDIKPCHKELIDMVVCYKEFGSNKYMDKISKTKVRGVISLLKQAKIIDVDWQGNRVLTEEEQQANERLCDTPDTPTSDVTFAPAKLLLGCHIHSYLDLRRQHDNYLIHFAYMNDREREEEHSRHHRDSGPKSTWNSDKATFRTDKTSFSEIIWTDNNADERLDYSPVIKHASEFFANNYRTIVESMKLTLDMEDSETDAVAVDNADPTTSVLPAIAIPRQSPTYRYIAESMKQAEDTDDSDAASFVNVWPATSGTPSIAFPRLSPVRVAHGPPMTERDSMKHSTDSGDTDASDSSPYSMWHSLLPPSQHLNSAAQSDVRVYTYAPQQHPPGYPYQPDASCASNVYGHDNSIYYDENIVHNTPPRHAHPLYARNSTDTCQSVPSIGFLTLQDYRKNFR